jgi:hypothetical protein
VEVFIEDANFAFIGSVAHSAANIIAEVVAANFIFLPFAVMLPQNHAS